MLDNLLEEARTHLQREEYGNALEVSDELLKLEPEHSQALELRKSASEALEQQRRFAGLLAQARGYAKAQDFQACYQVATQAFAKATTSIIHNQLRPFVRQARPTVDSLGPALRDLAKITPDLAKSFGVLNKFFNALAYKPSGVAESYLFYALWLNHIGASVYSTQDANGPIRRGIIFTDCIAAGALENVAKIDAQLGTLIALTNFPSSAQICGK